MQVCTWCSSKVLSKDFLAKNICWTTEKFCLENFMCLLYVHIYTKLQNFIQLSHTLAKLCHIKCDHVVNCCKMWKIGTMMQNMSIKCIARKEFNFNNPRWWTADALESPILHHRKILQFLVFKMATVCHLGILKFKFSTAMHFWDMFCIMKLNFAETCRIVAEILQFFTFM